MVDSPPASVADFVLCPEALFAVIGWILLLILFIFSFPFAWTSHDRRSLWTWAGMEASGLAW